MTVRNLEYLFAPKSIALIGAGNTPGSVGATIARNLFGAGFAGPIMPVNPRHVAVGGVLAYPDIAHLPLTPDLAVICTPAPSVPGIVADLGARGTRAAIVISAGFGETASSEGKALEQAVLDAARPHLLRVLGPNCVGALVPGAHVNASFAHLSPPAGPIAFVAQSGAIITAILDWAAPRGIGFSHLVSLGDMIDVDFGDVLDYLAGDGATHAILLYVEAITHARKFMSAARAAARSKPVIVVKSGRHAATARAVASHTGALAGVDAVYDAAFRRAGMLRVFELAEVFDAVAILAGRRSLQGERVAILSNGGGIAILATDALADVRATPATLSPETIAKLNAVLPPTWSHGNPVDIIGDADAARYTAALDVLLESRDADAVVVLNCPTAVSSNTDIARAVAESIGDRRQPIVLTNWVGAGSTAKAREIFTARGLPTYETPEAAVRGLGYLLEYRRAQEALIQTPPSVPEQFEPDLSAAQALVAAALAEGRQWLDEAEAKRLLAAYAIPVAETLSVDSPEAAAQAAARIGAPVALKIRSRDITHKSDVGGVVLDLDTPAAVAERARAMLAQIRARLPKARIDGFTVGRMIRRSQAYELIAGIVDDAQFGPVIVFGQGGTAVEVIDDKALGLPPLNMTLARELIGRTRVVRELSGYRDQPPANIAAIAAMLIKLAQLAADLPQVAELDINPLLADAGGVIALDARVRVAPARGQGGDRLAIRPYPKDLESEARLPDGRTFWLRPIRPEDEPALHAAFAELTPEQIRLRFFVPLKKLTHVAAARFTQIDYDREMVLLLTERGAPGATPIHGIVNLICDPDNERGEYAIVVHPELVGHGAGTLLMQRIIDYGRRRGLREIYGDVMAENHRMLAVCEDLGFRRAAHGEDPGIVRVTLALH
ncbi:MAG: GNAT family N-acetyltransferase [Gammaproteobacteria bacterium]